jgi:hypothetical protein
MNNSKKISTAFMLFLLGISSQANAQLDKILDRATDRATQRVESKVNQKVNQTVDKTVDKNVDKVLNPTTGNKTKPSSSTTTNGTKTNPNTDKNASTTTTTTTDKPISKGKTTTPNSTTEDKTTATNAVASTFLGSFQWEIKRYKNDKMVANGHSILAFLVKPYEIAVQVLDTDTGDKLKAYIYNRKNQNIVTINESEGTATKTTAATKSATSVVFNKTTEIKIVDGHECVKFTGNNTTFDIVLWVDENEKGELFNSFKNGIGVSRPDLDIIPLLSNVKTPVREAIIIDKKKAEKTHIWLNSLSTETPSEKAFDYSRYEMR